MQKVFRVQSMVVLLVGLLVIAACSNDVEQAASADSGELVIAVGGEPNTLNPIFGDIFGTIYGDHWPVFSSLLAYDGDLELQPDLAAAPPTFADDGLTVTVVLRDNVTFHDGRPLTADDVVFTYEAILDEQVGTRLRDLLFDSLEQVDAVDEHTVRFGLSRVDPAFVDKLTVGILPAHLLDGEDLNTAPFNVEPVGTGPFVFDEWREGERLVLTAFEDYHRGRPGLDRVVFTFVGDENTRVTQLEGEAIDVDAVGLSPSVAARFTGDDRFEVVQIPGDLLALTLPTHNELLANAEVRRAIGAAIDRAAIVEGVLGDAGRTVFGPIAPQHWAHDPGVTVDHDPDGAERTLEANGWTPGRDGILERDGQRFELELVYGQSAVVGDVALVIADTLRGLGIDTELRALGHGDRMERIAAGAASLDTLGNAYDPDLDAFQQFHSSHVDDNPGSNPARVADAAVDAALEAARSTMDLDERAVAYAQLQASLAEQGSWHFLAQTDNLLVVTTRADGVVPAVREGHIHGFSRGLLWNLHEWSVAQ